ncbi:MAG TPA: nucleoside 2-deoxyribosyltransferase domain-containing protein [Anaerolineae bacterium]|nr:nucleoside 2-deoxyribosyltransferase domain-containing protein [Anaerolineae bacterium]
MSTKRLITPPNRLEVDGPFVFLAGPIQGAPKWHEVAMGLLWAASASIWVVSPKRQSFDKGMDYGEQVDWETYYLQQAAETGVIMFWLAQEATHRCDRAYGQTSRFELGEWSVKHQWLGAKLVVGIEAGFSNGRYIRRRLGQDCPQVPVVASLAAACDEVVRLLGC